MERIRKIIREELENIFEDFEYRYDGNFFPTQDVISNSIKALGVVNRNNLTGAGNSNEGSGLSKAKSISNKEPMTHAQVKRMKAFFDNNKESVSSERSQGKTLENSGIIQSWELWGGDAGHRWSENTLNQRNSSNDSSKTLRGATGIRTKTLMDPHNTRIHR